MLLVIINKLPILCRFVTPFVTPRIIFICIFVNKGNKKQIRFIMATKVKQKDNPRLVEQKLSDGRISLHLEYYLGYTEKKVYDEATDTLKRVITHNRKKEALNIILTANARTPAEREQNKRFIELANTIRAQKDELLRFKAHGQVSPTKKNTNFYEYCDNYIGNYKKADVRMIKGVFEQFKTYLNDTHGTPKTGLKVKSLNPQMIEGFKDHLEESFRGTTPHSYFARFKKLLNSAVKEGLFDRSPADGISCKKLPDTLTKNILSIDEIKLLVKAHSGNDEVKRAFLFSLNTGLRWCDVKALRFENIDFAANRLKLEQQKTGHWVNIDLNPMALRLIGGKGNPKHLVFTLPSANGANGVLKYWADRAKIGKHITWHCARHSIAVNLLSMDGELKTDIKTVSSILGHSSLKMTEKYLHVVDKLKKEAVNNLPDFGM